MIHELKIDLEDPNGIRQQLNLMDYANGFNGSVQVRFNARHGFTISCLGRQTTILFHLGGRQVALTMEEIVDVFTSVFQNKVDKEPKPEA
jgi:hypothetical protein